jgi:hypothetical protein
MTATYSRTNSDSMPSTGTVKIAISILCLRTSANFNFIDKHYVTTTEHDVFCSKCKLLLPVQVQLLLVQILQIKFLVRFWEWERLEICTVLLVQFQVF